MTTSLSNIKVTDGTNNMIIKADDITLNGTSVLVDSATWGNIDGTLSDQTDLNTALNNKQDEATAVNYNNITNCITEIPQDIKLELNDGMLTLKAGSKVYVPNGSGIFNEVVISSDITRSTGDEGKLLVFYPNGGNFLDFVLLNKCYSGTTSPGENWCMWYDTSSNYIYFYSTDSQNPDRYVSLPLAIITISNGAISSIDQVFNGFGYIGSTIFALPGVKGLVPNGRNEDGSLKNYEITTSTNSVLTATNTVSYTGDIAFTSGWLDAASGTLYNEIDNKNYQSDGITYYGRCLAGKFVKGANGVITSFTPKTAFHAVDYNDFKQADDNNVKLTGNQAIYGMKGFENYVYHKDMIEFVGGTYSTNPNNPQDYGKIGFADSTGKKTAVIGNYSNTSGTNICRMVANLPTDNTKYGELFVAVNSSGNAFTYAPTPATSDNSTQIATTAYVNNKFQVVSSLPTSPDADTFYFVTT